MLFLEKSLSLYLSVFSRLETLDVFRHLSEVAVQAASVRGGRCEGAAIIAKLREIGAHYNLADIFANKVFHLFLGSPWGLAIADVIN